MNFLIIFLDGILTFISPCVLPMLPVYFLYFTGGNVSSSENANNEGKKKSKALMNSLAFVFGFMVVYTLLGAFAGVLGGLLMEYERVISIVFGIIVVLLGINYTGLIKIPLLNGAFQAGGKSINIKNVFSAFAFGILFAVGWSPCTTAFLGHALSLAADSSSMWKGILLLVTYSAGLGMPFVVSAVLIEQMTAVFGFIKKHYNIINIISGLLLIVMGVLMITGLINYLY